MNFIVNMSVRNKLRALALLSVLSLVGVSVVGFWGIRSMGVGLGNGLTSVQSAATLRLVLTGIIGLVIILLGFLAISNTISDSLRILVEHMHSLAQGDFTVRIVQKTTDEIGMAFGAIHSLQVSMGQTVRRIAEVAEGLAGSSHELAVVLNETNSSVGEVAATSTELAQTINTVSHNTAKMTEAANQISDTAVSGGEALDLAIGETKALEAAFEHLSSIINNLGESSQAIEQLVDMIGAISDQTNLLALNAAIEAARAGVHGRGFAVVAEEVRELAENSRTAAAQIAKLVQEVQTTTSQAVEEMSSGTEQMTGTSRVISDSGKILQDILQAINDVSSQINEIAVGAREISAGSQEVAALTEAQSTAINQVTPTSQRLDSMAQELAGLVAQFKIRDNVS